MPVPGQMKVIMDLVEGTSITEGPNGIEITRTGCVLNIPGKNKYDRLAQARTAPGVPRRLDRHPAADFNALRADVVTVAPLDKDCYQAAVTVEYKLLDSTRQEISETAVPQIEVGGSVQSSVTSLDVKGDPLFLSQTILVATDTEYTDPITEKHYNKGDLVPRLIETVAEAQVELPVFTLRLQRREPVSPFKKAKEYIGKINASDFLGDPPHTWLVRNVSGPTIDGSRSWSVTYELARRLTKSGDNWDPMLALKDSQNRPYSGLIEGQGIKRFQVYEDIDFTGLHLDGIQ